MILLCQEMEELKMIKNRRKWKKYQDLARERGKIWNTSGTVVPIVVVEALGAVVSNLKVKLVKLNIDKKEIPKVKCNLLHCWDQQE